MIKDCESEGLEFKVTLLFLPLLLLKKKKKKKILPANSITSPDGETGNLWTNTLMTGELLAVTVILNTLKTIILTDTDLFNND